MNLAEDESFEISCPDSFSELICLGRVSGIELPLEDFYSFNVRDYEVEFKIMTKESLKTLIEHWQDEITSQLRELIDNPDSIHGYLRSKINTWDRKERYYYPPYLLKKKKDNDFMVSSDLHYEYAIFNLVSIFRNFDWENDYLIYNGW